VTTKTYNHHNDVLDIETLFDDIQLSNLAEITFKFTVAGDDYRLIRFDADMYSNK